MAKTASLNIRIDPETKARAEELFGSFGITVTDAINMFLRQSLMVHGLPFKLRQPQFNDETLEAIREADEMIASGNYVAYNSAREAHEAALAENLPEDFYV
ncbi:MAG: type II toxin-antitoxin system RelB/DinJ family antitoxin [Clostridiales bacterium]|jgi:DNA-damage-inducible protein J|nr:type II toxin-antitoxin system RelB/DinJ family antitoxin [Clostridiales bacterium]